jgi:hypothetical protein
MTANNLENSPNETIETITPSTESNEVRSRDELASTYERLNSEFFEKVQACHENLGHEQSSFFREPIEGAEREAGVSEDGTLTSITERWETPYGEAERTSFIKTGESGNPEIEAVTYKEPESGLEVTMQIFSNDTVAVKTEGTVGRIYNPEKRRFNEPVVRPWYEVGVGGERVDYFEKEMGTKTDAEFTENLLMDLRSGDFLVAIRNSETEDGLFGAIAKHEKGKVGYSGGCKTYIKD